MSLEGLQGAIISAATGAVADALERICEEARAMCPANSGELRNSITANASGMAGQVTVSAKHGAYVELGTYQQKAQPFLQPAFAQNKGKVAAEIARRLREAL